MKLADVVMELRESTKLYLKDSYVRSAQAEVIRVVREKRGSRCYVVVEPVIFHPLGGGQPGDRGWLRGEGVEFEVKKTLESRGVIVLYGRVVSGRLEEGAEVLQELDWERRYRIMRTHTAGHILDRAVSELAGAGIATLGANHGPPEPFIDYGIGVESLDLREVERVSNELLDDRDVRIRFVKPEELPSAIYGAPNLGRLPKAERYRVVEIVGVNAIPCTGTHVRKTSEVGQITLRGSKAIEGGVRIYYDVSP